MFLKMFLRQILPIKYLLAIIFYFSFAPNLLLGFNEESKIVLSTKKILLDEFPHSFNPSLIKYEEGYLLTFRFCPQIRKNWFSEIGVILLNQEFKPIHAPQLLNTRFEGHTAPPQAEDARIISYKGQLYLIYNDNTEKFVYPKVRRDMYIAKLQKENGRFELSPPVKLQCQGKSQLWEKNWVPFVWQDQLLLSYSIMPHEILIPEIVEGSCKTAFNTATRTEWKWGFIRGGTPAQIVDGKYLAFFHSTFVTRTKYSNYEEMKHCFLGAYTFNSEPPFQITHLSSKPLVHSSFYKSDKHIRVIFPGSFVVVGNKIHLVYGKDDYEIWMATIDKDKLFSSLKPMDNEDAP